MLAMMAQSGPVDERYVHPTAPVEEVNCLFQRDVDAIASSIGSFAFCLSDFVVDELIMCFRPITILIEKCELIKKRSSFSSSMRHSGITTTSLALYSLLVLLLFAVAVRYSRYISSPVITHEYTYVGQDFPRTWDIGALDIVHMSVENTGHYSFNNSLGDAEWEALVPHNGVLSFNEEKFTISYFHQLRCLNIVRKGIVAFRDPGQRQPPSRLVRHCMNYLRQMVLCRANIHLESVRDHVGPHVAVSETTHVCQDWSAVYEAAEALQNE
ncbi:hypothetical protein BDZ89DRAFT_1146895 [Hymenopellis radicata]|nr:hypothetical protein BDZ89DRAFT_1146895 [Hymenopellis radicata]